MSKPNLTSDVLNAVQSGKSSATEIARFTLGNINSVRSALARLSSRGEIQRVSRGRYYPVTIGEAHTSSLIDQPPKPEFVYRHYLADIKYKRGIAGIAYTIEDVDMEQEILETMAEKLPFEYLDTFGYSKDQVVWTGQDLSSVEFVGFHY